MDILTGMEFISDVKFQLKIVSKIYDKIAALRIHEINSNNVIKKLKYTMFIVQRIQSRLTHYEHTSIVGGNLVTIAQASLLLEKPNEVSILTKIYRAVRILRNERSRFGKDLSPEDCRWADRYLELCRRRGLNLVQRKYAAQFLAKISETISVYRLVTIKETKWANMNFADPTNFTLKEFSELDPVWVNMKIEQILASKYPQGKELLKKIFFLRDNFSKILGFQNYVHYSLQSQNFTPNKANVLMFTLANITLSLWVKNRDKCLKEKREKTKDIPFEFTYKELTYYHRLVPAAERVPMNNFFPLEKTVEKIFDLFGDYFGLNFTYEEKDENECRIFRIRDADTSKFLSLLVLDLFSQKTKPGLKTTVAFHKPEKRFSSDFLENLDDEFKTDPRFQVLKDDCCAPLVCYVVTDIREKYGRTINQDLAEECLKCSTTIDDNHNSIQCEKCINLQQQIERDGELMLTLFDVLHICHELGYVLWHIFGQASSQILRTCCSGRDFLDIPSSILQCLVLQPNNLQRISSSVFMKKDMSIEQAEEMVKWYEWEEPFKVLSLILNGYVDHFCHVISVDPNSLINEFFTHYFLIKKDETVLCPDLLLSMTEEKAGRLYSKSWGYFVGKLIFDATFKVRDFDRQVGRDFRKYFLEPDLNVDFNVRLRNFLKVDPDIESSIEKSYIWF